MLPLGIDSTASLPKATRFSLPITILPNAPHVSSTVDHAVPCNCMSFGPEPSYCGAPVRKSSQILLMLIQSPFRAAANRDLNSGNISFPSRSEEHTSEL